MKKRTSKIATAFIVFAIALFNIAPNFSEEGDVSVNMGLEAKAYYSYNIWEDDWQQCDDATILIMSPTGPMPVDVDGYKNSCVLSWASDCWSVDCSILINP